MYGRRVHWPWTRLHVSGPMGSISDAYQSGQRSLLFEWWKNMFFYYINDIIGKKRERHAKIRNGWTKFSFLQLPLSSWSSYLNPTSGSSTAPPPRPSPSCLLSLACSSSSRVVRFAVPLQGSILLGSFKQLRNWVKIIG